MLGPRTTRLGARLGVCVGQSGEDPMSAVARDLTSGKLVPSTTSEWALVLAAAGITSGGPTSTRLYQEASGAIADTLDSSAHAVSGGSWAYRQPVPGWSRLAITVPDGAANHNLQNTTNVPDVATTSALLLGYVLMPSAAPTANRRIAHLDGSSIAAIQISATPRLQCVTGGTGGSTVSGSADPTGAGVVRPLAIAVNRAANTVRVISDQEIIRGTQGTYSGVSIGWGSSGATTPAMGLLWDALFTGAAAELTDAQIKALLFALNWPTAWSP